MSCHLTNAMLTMIIISAASDQSVTLHNKTKVYDFSDDSDKLFSVYPWSGHYRRVS